VSQNAIYDSTIGGSKLTERSHHLGGQRERGLERRKRIRGKAVDEKRSGKIFSEEGGGREVDVNGPRIAVISLGEGEVDRRDWMHGQIPGNMGGEKGGTEMESQKIESMERINEEANTSAKKIEKGDMSP